MPGKLNEKWGQQTLLTGNFHHCYLDRGCGNYVQKQNALFCETEEMLPDTQPMHPGCRQA